MLLIFGSDWLSCVWGTIVQVSRGRASPARKRSLVQVTKPMNTSLLSIFSTLMGVISVINAAIRLELGMARKDIKELERKSMFLLALCLINIPYMVLFDGFFLVLNGFYWWSQWLLSSLVLLVTYMEYKILLFTIQTQKAIEKSQMQLTE